MDEEKVKILVVDDRPENLLAMDRLLRPLGAEIYKVDSGEKALSEVLRRHFAVILLDVQMPGMDGFETASLMHSNKQTANIPIIFVTALNKDEAYISKGYESGAVDYLSKPINPEILLGKVKVFLQLEKQRLTLEQVSKELRWSSRKNKLLLDCAAEGISGLDKSGHITFINPTGCSMLAGKEEQFLNQPIQTFLFEDQENEQTLWEHSDIKQKCLGEGKRVQISGEMLRMSRNKFPVEASVAPMLDSKNQVQGAVLVFQDITERKKLEDQLLQMAKYDSLTGLANRTLFKEFLTASLARSERRGKSTAVLFLDLDHFKEINDTLGHDAGDKLLSSVARRVQTCVREGDLVARVGGDEFAVVLDDIADPEDSRVIAEKILEDLKTPHDLGGEQRQVGSSIGIAAFPEAGREPDELIKAADEAMYVAKKGGRNGYRVYSDLNPGIL